MLLILVAMEQVWKLLLFMSCMVSNTLCYYGEIKVIGYGSVAEKWAVGISGLKFHYSVNLTTALTGERKNNQLAWFTCHNNIKRDIAKANVDSPNSECLGFLPAQTRASNATCHFGRVLETTVTLDTTNWTMPLVGLGITRKYPALTTLNFISFTIEKCRNDSDEFLISTDARYNESATVSCNHSNLVNSSSLSHYVGSGIFFCNAFAEWSGLSDLACWKGPHIRNLISLSNNYTHNKAAEFKCDIEPGLPTNTSAELCFGKEDCFTAGAFNHSDTIVFNVPMIPKYNGLNVTCNAWNDYMKVPGVNKAAHSSGGPLHVQFGPYDDLFEVVTCSPSINITFNIQLRVNFLANPSCVALRLDGDHANQIVKKVDGHSKEIDGSMPKEKCCGVDRQYFEFNVSNVGIHGVVNISCIRDGLDNSLFYEKWNLTESASCFPDLASTTEFLSSHHPAPTQTGSTVTSLNQTATINVTPLSEAAIAGIAVGGAALILCIALMVYLCWKRKKKSESFSGTSQNPAFSASVPDQQNSERQECSNILYGTADDLKSGGTSGSNSKEVVDNVLYGSTAGPQLSNEVYASVNKTGKKGANDSEQAADLYSSVQKTKKSKTNGKGVDPGASTSNFQSGDTYAEVDKVGKKKKDGKNARKGKQNAGFSNDLEQDVTYAAVDKKTRKGAKDKKSDNKPGTSAMVEEATYAEVNKPKKDGPDDEDLHGSNK